MRSQRCEPLVVLLGDDLLHVGVGHGVDQRGEVLRVVAGDADLEQLRVGRQLGLDLLLEPVDRVAPASRSEASAATSGRFNAAFRTRRLLIRASWVAW